MYRSVLRLLPIPARRHLQYAKAHRRRLHLQDPVRFSDKVNWRIVNDHRDELAWTCDKLRMKERAEQAGLRVPRTLWSGTDVGEILDIDLPPRWVLKPNHRSGHVHLGRGTPTRELLDRAASGWLDETQYGIFGEWAYGEARPCVLLEEWVGDDDEPPDDYKVFVFGGVPELVQMDVGRFSAHTRRFYLPHWTPLEVRHTFPLAPLRPKPEHLAEMLDAAAEMGADFDFIRVDLYDTPDGVYFGEVTPYPGAGLERFEPDWLDLELGELWKLGESGGRERWRPWPPGSGEDRSRVGR